MFIGEVCSALERYAVPYAIVGGHAVALHGAVRGTVDVDFVIRWQKQHLQNAEAALKSIDLESRLPISAEDVFHFRDEYIQNRNLIGWSFFNSTSPAEQVDLIINFDLGRKRTKSIGLKNGQIHILNKKDLIKMKKDSGREQDLADIAALEKL